MQFTEKFISALKAKVSRYDVREKSGEGFGIRVSPTGEKSWIFFYTFNGRKRRMTLGNYPHLTLAEARKRHREALKLLEMNKDPGLVKKAKSLEARISHTVEDLIEEYLEKWAKPRKRSWREDKRILDKDVKAAWGKRKAKDITRRDMIFLLDRIKERGAPIAANRTLACIRRMYNFAIERDIVSTSPCIAVKAPSKENRLERCLSLDEIYKLWHALSDGLHTIEEANDDKIIIKMAEATKLALKLQLVTAQRKGEIVTAEWGEIDVDAGWWTIPAEKAKNGNTHRVPLSTLAIEILKQVKELNGNSRWLFPSPRADKPVTGAAIDHAVRRSHFTGIKHFSPHSLRRTTATHMTAMGISRLVVSKILNHVDGGVTAIYDRHSYDAEKKHALEMWAIKLKEIINGSETINNIFELKNAG